MFAYYLMLRKKILAVIGTLRLRISSAIERFTFSLVRKIKPKTTHLLGEAIFVARGKIEAISSAAIINDDQAVMTPETLRFYLRGIFHDEADFVWALSLFPNLTNISFVTAEKCLADALRGANSPTAEAFAAHIAITARSRRAYSVSGRDNPNTVYWPDPTLTDLTHPSAGRSLYTELPFARKI